MKIEIMVTPSAGSHEMRWIDCVSVVLPRESRQPRAFLTIRKCLRTGQQGYSHSFALPAT